MKVIVAGGRKFDNYDQVKRILDERKDKITEVVCGCAEGADSLGFTWAKENGIPVRHFPAPWKHLDYAAGPVRNGYMAEYADALVAFPGNNGTADMIKQARQHKLKIKIVKENE